LKIEFAGSQVEGARAQQQDDYVARRIQFPADREAGIISAVFVLADGMGGHRGGQEAAHTAVRGFVSALEQVEAFTPATLRACLDAANRDIAEQLQHEAALKGMGTTLIGAIVRSGLLHWISVGDSLLLLSNGRDLARLNEDHSMAPKLDAMARMGQITAEVARRDPRRHALLDAVRGQALRHVDDRRDPMPLKDGDRLLIASDGIATLSERDWFDILQAHRDDDGATVEDLLSRVEAVGDPEQDNATCIVVSVRNDAPNPTDEIIATQPA